MRHKTKHQITVISVLFLVMGLVIGCARYRLIKANKDIPVGTSIVINSPVAWSEVKLWGVETWTIDGPSLQRLMFFTGIRNGRPLFTVEAEEDKTLPLFKSTMNVLEIVEFVEASLKRMGSHNVGTKSLRPEKFDSLEGFRFDLSFTSADGLNYSGIFQGAMKDNCLVAMMYIGTELYYFDKNLNDVENIFASAKIK